MERATERVTCTRCAGVQRMAIREDHHFAEVAVRLIGSQRDKAKQIVSMNRYDDVCKRIT